MMKITTKQMKQFAMFNSLVHSSIVSVSSVLYICDYIDLDLIKNFYIFSICYFILDYLIILNYYDLKNKIIYFFHHTIASYILYCFINQNDYNKLIPIGLTSEIPIIFLNINWFLIKYKKQNTILFTVIDYISIITYFIFRICTFTYILFANYYIYGNTYNNISKIFNIIYILNCMWFIGIYKRFKGKLILKKYN